jgi:hypothetical protein
MNHWDRLWAKTTLMDGCWVSALGICRDGYSQVRIAGRKMMAHVVSWEAVNGPVPDGLELDHSCRVRACWNPAHLEAVTHAENMRRGDNWETRKTHCPKGHPYDEANTMARRSRPNRICRECNRSRCREQHRRRKTQKVAR